MGRRTVLLLASILVAAVGTALVGLYVRSADTRARAQEQLVVVWVAKEQVPPTTKIEDRGSSFRAVEYPLRLRPEKAVRDLQEVRDLVVTTTIYKDQLLLSDQLRPAGSPGSTEIGNGNVLANVSVDDLTRPRLGKDIGPGIEVQVLVTKAKLTEGLLEKVKVHSIAPAQDGATEDGAQQTVTLVIPNRDLVKTIDASKNGEITLIPVSESP